MGHVADHFGAVPRLPINCLAVLPFAFLFVIIHLTSYLTLDTFNDYKIPSTMSSYDPILPEGVMSQEQFRASMKLVRLQIAVPISVLASIAANIVCALAIKPGLREYHLICPHLPPPPPDPRHARVVMMG